MTTSNLLNLQVNPGVDIGDQIAALRSAVGLLAAGRTAEGYDFLDGHGVSHPRKTRALLPELLRMLLHSGFRAKCGAPHFRPFATQTPA